MKSSRWTRVILGVIAFLTLATMVSASPPPTASRAGRITWKKLNQRFVNDDRKESMVAAVEGAVLSVRTTPRAIPLMDSPPFNPF